MGKRKKAHHHSSNRLRRLTGQLLSGLTLAVKIFFWTGEFILLTVKKLIWNLVSLLWETGRLAVWFGTILWRLLVSQFARRHPKPGRKSTIPASSKKRLPKFPGQTGIRGKWRYFLLGVLACFFVITVPSWLIAALTQLPHPETLTLRTVPVSTKILDRNGILLYQFYADENRSPVSLADLPSYVLAATIAIEDKNFSHHPGVDLQGITRAAAANLRGQTVQGGSTLTQQLVKSALLSPERTFQRKIKEIVLSLWTERVYSKNQILEMYLNQIPYGGAAYGIEAAAQTYFNKNARDLTLAEAALLAGLPAAPSDYSPFGTRPKLAKQRQAQVLDAMGQQGLISPAAAEAAKNEPLKLAQLKTEIRAPHFVMYVKDYLSRKYGIRTVEQGGLEVTTTLDYSLYEIVWKLLREGVAAQKDLQVGNGAVLVTNPKNGEILTLVGSIDYFDIDHDGNVNVTIAQRSPGSAIKPLNYALALEKGHITPATIINDAPITFQQTKDLPPYSPQNYDNRFHGPVTARVALASSYNVPAVKILEKTGLVNFVNWSRNFGINSFSSPDNYGLSLTLGGGETTMIELATAYGAFANAGIRVNLKPVVKVVNFRGVILENSFQNHHEERIVSAETAFLISDILADNAARAPTFGLNSPLLLNPHRVAVKTGTTQEKRDNWAIGYTPSLLVAVWVGNNDNSPMSPYLESGRTGAAVIWNPIMTTLLAQRSGEPFPVPAGIVSASICLTNGLLSCPNCPTVKQEYFIRGSEPKRACRISPEEKEKLIKSSRPPKNP